MGSRTAIYYLSAVMITAWFLAIAYQCNTQNKAVADEIYDNYLKFYTWSEPQLKRSIKNTPFKFLELPKPGVI